MCVFSDASSRFQQKFGVNIANRFGHVKSPSVNLPPYYEEPFLYSIPRIPARPPPSHIRTQSEKVEGRKASPDTFGLVDDFSQPPALSASSPSLTSSHPHRVSLSHQTCSDTSAVGCDPQNLLTTAFQNSLSTSTSDSHSSYPPTSLGDVPVIHPISPPASIRGWRSSIRHARASPARHRKSIGTVAGLMRTSAAEPVVSFAQADGFDPASHVVKTRGPRHSSPLRARSPYPVVRGRRSSPLRSRLKVSDQDLADSLQNTDLGEKFGLERFLAPDFPRHKVLDENTNLEEEAVERGRTRSRVRTRRG